MITNNVGTLTLRGKSGKEYNLTLHTFDSFDEVKEGFNGHGLYVFTKQNADTKKHTLIYLGMASSFTTRFDNHHKENCIKRNGANCIGIHLMNNSTPESRKAAESDILAANNFACNEQENQ